MQQNVLNYKNYLNLSQTSAFPLFENIFYPWECLPLIKNFIINIGKNLPKDKYEQIKENVWISKNAEVADSAHIDGPTIIEEGAQIRHCAFIRGSALIGKNSVVGNSSEIKNSILFNNVQMPHFNYVGDSDINHIWAQAQLPQM